jgi:Flp pilus assembly protein TadD
MTPQPPRALAAALALAGLAASLTLPGTACAQVMPASPAAPGAPPGDGGAKTTLAQQARSWEDRGRSDFAAAAWRKLLAVEPANSDALYGLALAQINLGQAQAAAEPLATLRRARPDHPGLRKLERHIAQGSNDTGLLKEARRLAAASQYDAASREYELLLSDRTPQGPLALEYYQTLGGTSAGWEPARRGLERLTRTEPGDARYALALARHLSYREPSRRDAIRQLAALMRSDQSGSADAAASSTPPALSPEQRQEAREAWRQALLWLDARDADQPLYRQFLEAGDDAPVRARLTTLQQGVEEGRRSAEARERDPTVRSRRAGFDALGGGDLPGAAERFQRVLKDRPRDPDALGGLGVVRLREGRLTEARDLLTQAVAGSGGGSTSPWHKGLQSVELRLQLQQAEQALAQHQPQQALDLARRAGQLDPQDPAALAVQGEALLALDQPAQAEARLRQALGLAPSSEPAWRGLLRALHAQGRVGDADLLVESLDDDNARRFGGRGGITAEHLRLSAETLRRRGDLAGAQTELEQALQLDPQAPWVRLALAQLALARGQELQARALMNELQPGSGASTRRETDTWWARAQWQAELNEPLAGLAALDRIAPAERRPEMASLHRRLRVGALIARAQDLTAQGQIAAALTQLQQAQTAAAGDTELLPGLAAAYAEAGQPQRAQQLLRSALTQERGTINRTTQPAARQPLLLQYAQLLQASKQDGELVGVLGQIQSQPLSAAQREQFDGLRLGLALRQVDQLRDAGDTAEAYEVLAPLLAERPVDARLKLALARLYASVGDNNETLETLDAVLLAEPDTLDVWLSAAAIASGLREHDYALGALQRAEALAPQDPRVLAQYSRHYRARGELARAAEYMRAAIASNQRGNTPGTAATANSHRAAARAAAEPQWGRPLGADNPFAARAATQGGRSAGLGGSAGEAPTELPARRLPPVPGLGGLAAPQDTRPLRPLPSTEDWLRGSRSEQRPAAGGLPRLVGAARTDTHEAGSAASYAPPGTWPQSTSSTVAVPVQPGSIDTSALWPLPADTWTTAGGAYPTLPASGALDNLPGNRAPQWRHAAADLNTLATATAQAAAQSAAAWPSVGTDRYAADRYVVERYVGAEPAVDSPPLLPRRNTAGAAPAPRSLRDELAEIVAERGSRELEGVATLRWRNGEAGLSQLVELRSPVGLQLPLGEVGKLQLRLTPTLVDAGSSPSDADGASRFGSQALAGGTAPTSINVSAAGVGLRLGLAGRRWSADLGSTPLGFRIVNAVGGVQFGGEFTPQLGWGVELQRRAVTDSVLSYAGVRDPRTGTVWGGVTATGLSGSLAWKDADLQLAGYGGLQALDGRGVRNNQRLDLGVAATWRISDEAQERIEIGSQLGYQHHAHNLRHFTLGHGGYFSPQHQLTLALPMKAVGRDKRLSWSIAAAPGLNAWREDAAPYFPTDAAAQAQLVNRVALGLATQSSYAARSSFGMSLALQGGTEYSLSNRLLVGSRLNLDTASQYTQLGASLYLRLSLDGGEGAPATWRGPLVEPAPRLD